MLPIATAEGVAAITAGATLLAAVGLAAVTIQTAKQRRTDDREKRERELDAETERLTVTLAHDRALVDVADLRQLLDETATAIAYASSAQEYAWHCFDLPDVTFRSKAGLAREIDQRLEDVNKLLAGFAPRLRLRLGTEDPVTMACVEVKAAVDRMKNVALGFRVKQEAAQTTRSEAAEAWKLMQDATEAFFAAGVEQAGAVMSAR